MGKEEKSRMGDDRNINTIITGVLKTSTVLYSTFINIYRAPLYNTAHIINTYIHTWRYE
jgi:hypothetical protein